MPGQNAGGAKPHSRSMSARYSDFARRSSSTCTAPSSIKYERRSADATNIRSPPCLCARCSSAATSCAQVGSHTQQRLLRADVGKAEPPSVPGKRPRRVAAVRLALTCEQTAPSGGSQRRKGAIRREHALPNGVGRYFGLVWGSSGINIAVEARSTRSALTKTRQRPRIWSGVSRHVPLRRSSRAAGRARL